tara:strand:- start:116 stop:502 length:387 start_codon:yes stop_codon:yes gene_type:complete
MHTEAEMEEQRAKAEADPDHIPIIGTTDYGAPFMGGLTTEEAVAAGLLHDSSKIGNDLGDLVDPQDGTYEEEGTHGLPLAAAAPMLGRMAGMAATSFGMKAGSNLADKVTGGGSGGGGGGGAGGSTSY